MAERKPEWQEAGDLIMTAIEMVADYGAYAKFDGLQGTFRRE